MVHDARISVLSPKEHDSMIAYVSQLTHCIAISLMTGTDLEHVENFTGDSFRDLTRIARINENMWSELSRLSKSWFEGDREQDPEYRSYIKSLEQEFSTIYDKFRLHFYTQIFSRFENREATLTTVESFSMDCIMAMDHPTVAEFAAMMNISAPNAAYRVNSLCRRAIFGKSSRKRMPGFFTSSPPRST